MYKIVYFENSSNTIQVVVFKGKKAFINAVSFGRENIFNFNMDCITEIKAQNNHLRAF